MAKNKKIDLSGIPFRLVKAFEKHVKRRETYTAKSGQLMYRLVGACEQCQADITLNEARRRKGHFLCRLCSGAYGFFDKVPVLNKFVWDNIDKVVSAEILDRVYPSGSMKQYVFQFACATKGCKNTCSSINIAAGIHKGAKPKFFCVSCSQESRKDLPYAYMYKALVRRGLKKETKKMVMSYAEFAEKMEDKACFYCNAPIERATHRRQKSQGGYQLDKLDPLLPYTKSNSVSCCHFCNITKSAFVTSYEMVVVGLVRQGKMAEAAAYAKKIPRRDNDRRINEVRQTVYAERYYVAISAEAEEWHRTRLEKQIREVAKMNLLEGSL